MGIRWTRGRRGGWGGRGKVGGCNVSVRIIIHIDRLGDSKGFRSTVSSWSTSISPFVRFSSLYLFPALLRRSHPRYRSGHNESMQQRASRLQQYGQQQLWVRISCGCDEGASHQLLSLNFQAQARLKIPRLTQPHWALVQFALWANLPTPDHSFFLCTYALSTPGWGF